MNFIDRFLGLSQPATADHSTLSELIVATRLQSLMDAQVDYSDVPAIVRAKTMTQKVVASFPVDSWRGTSRAPEQPLIVSNPNPDQTRRQAIEETGSDMMWGEAYWELTNYNGLQPTQWRCLPRKHMVVTWNHDQTEREYYFKNRKMRNTGPFRNLAVLSVDRGSGDLVGKGPLSSDRISGIISTLSYIEEFFENAGNPTGILTKAGSLTKDEAEALQKQWVAARTTRAPAVVAGGLTWESTSFNPTDSAWVDAYFATVLDVANLFGIPASILGFNSPGSSLRYENTQDSWEAWYRGTLGPVYVDTIESEWSRLVPRGQDVRFTPNTLTRLGAKDRADFYSKALDPATGWLELSEVRELEGLTDVPSRVMERDTNV